MSGEARVVVEALRSGVPSREMAREVVLGRDGSIANVRRLLEAVEQDHPSRRPAYLYRANYGEGKTHLLYSLWGMAEERNWVVSFLTLSRETTLDRLYHIYPKLVAKTHVPGSRHPGCDRIVRQALGAPLDLAQARAVSELSPRVETVWENLTNANLKAEDYALLVGDIGGDFLKISDLKYVHRQTCGKPLKIGRSSLKEEVPHYFQLMDWLIRRAGFQGWLILFDEVELIGTLGKGARSRAYANMGRFLSGFLPHTVTVWAIAANFESDVLIRRNDREQCPAWLAGRPRDAAGVPWCTAAIDAVMGAAPLDPLSPAKMQALVAQILDLHQRAYQWQSPFDAASLYERVRRMIPTLDARLRTWVRLTITVLDIWFQYGEDPVVKFEELREAQLEEFQSEERDDDEASGTHIVREPLF